MNRRIRKKRQKKLMLEYSFWLIPKYPIKKRRKIVSKQWNMYNKAGSELGMAKKSYKLQFAPSE